MPALLVFLLLSIGFPNISLCSTHKDASEEKADLVIIDFDLLYAKLNDNNFSNVGGSELIDLLERTIEAYHSNKKSPILEISCGYGGGANYLSTLGYKNITAIDSNEKAIDFAQKNYPQISYRKVSIPELTDNFDFSDFSVTYILNIANLEHDRALLWQKIKSLGKERSLLIMSDFISPDEDKPHYYTGINKEAREPLYIKRAEKFLNFIGFKTLDVIDITPQYIKWYSNYVEKLKSQKQSFIANGFSEKEIQHIIIYFEEIIRLCREGKLGGVIMINKKL